VCVGAGRGRGQKDLGASTGKLNVGHSRSLTYITTLPQPTGTLLLLLSPVPVLAFLIGGLPRRGVVVVGSSSARVPSSSTSSSSTSSSSSSRRQTDESVKALGVLSAATKTGGDEEGNKKKAPATRKKATTPKSSSSKASAAASSPSPSSSSSSSSSSSPAPQKAPAAPKKQKQQHKFKEAVEAPFYEEALLDGKQASEVYTGEKVFNLMGQSEDVIAPWSVDGFEIDIPDWRPQPAQHYEIVDPSVLEQLGKIENMFGASLKLVSTHEGVWRFLYLGNIRNLIGAEAWTKLLLQEDLKLEGVKEVRFETNYVRDWPDDHN